MPFLVFDIETFPITHDKKLETLVRYKVRNVPEEEKEEKIKSYCFHEPQYSRVICISYLISIDGENIAYKDTFFSREDEESLIRNFISVVEDFENTYRGVYVTYNGIDFDVPYLLYKCALYNINPPQRFCNLIRFRNNPHYDVMQVMTNWGKFKISLQEMCYSFGVIDPKEIKEDGESTLDFMLRATDEEIILYNTRDVDSLFSLYKQISKIFQ
uniref:Predicted 3'-5' exonuclease PolB-like domain-containing protein n=1 Tax=Dictyoglomus turgidum TaxID=513050 RepID=A0A7C3SMJ5_9BACT